MKIAAITFAVTMGIASIASANDVIRGAGGDGGPDLQNMAIATRKAVGGIRYQGGNAIADRKAVGPTGPIHKAIADRKAVGPSISKAIQARTKNTSNKAIDLNQGF